MQAFKSLLIISLAAILPGFCWAQVTFFNNSAEIFVSNNAIVHVNGNMETNGNNGLLINNGNVTVVNSNQAGEFIITSGTVSGNGEFNVDADWINNGFFTNNNDSKVNLTGSQQLITGNNSTGFYDLELMGTGVKTQTIDAVVAGELTLNNHELATQNYIMYVSNVNPGAVSNNQTTGDEGFVSSTGNGALSRQTNSSSSYFYPVGSSDGTRRYRPVEIRPSSSDLNVFDIRLVNNDANDDGLNRSNKDSSLCRINPHYYHQINHTSGSDAADISLYYKLADGDYNAIANCNTSNFLWSSLGSNTSFSALPANFYALTYPGWNNFTWEPFALAEEGGIIAEFDTTDIGFFSEAYEFTDNSSGFPAIWHWDFGDGNTSSSQNPTHEYTEPGFYEVMLVSESEKGCLDTAYKTIEVREGTIIPNVFSPNNDGMNDIFRIPSVGLTEFQLIIYNRWGDKIFQSESKEIAWDGRTFAGNEAPPGTYFFILKAISASKDYYPEKTGHLTLVR